MYEILAVAAVTVVAVISPGPDFALVVRNAARHGRRSGILCAAGIALGVQVHVFYAMFGARLLSHYAPPLLQAVKLAGALYLIYMGCRAWRRQPAHQANPTAEPPPPRGSALRSGFWTNALNPKTTLFVLSTYTQCVSPATPLALQFAYGLFMSLTHAAWFGTVAVAVSSPALRRFMPASPATVERAAGAALITFGVLLAFAQLPG